MILLHVKKDHFPYGVSAQIWLLLKDSKLFFFLNFSACIRVRMTKFYPWIMRKLNVVAVWKCLKTMKEKSPNVAGEGQQILTNTRRHLAVDF